MDGQKLPSVTHVLQVIGKPALIAWAANEERAACLGAAADLYLDVAQTPPMTRPVYLSTLEARIGKEKAHRKTLAKAGEIGSQAHALIEWDLRRSLGQVVGPEPKVVDDAQWAFMAWQDWARAVDLKPLAIEQVVFSLTHEYAGTLDLLAAVNGVTTVVDWKTGKAIYAEAHLQNAAYRTAINEMGHGPVSHGLIVRLPKVQTDPAFEVAESPALDELMPTFLHALGLWKWWWAQEQAARAKWQAKKAEAA
jgi:hypothetical protein